MAGVTKYMVRKLMMNNSDGRLLRTIAVYTNKLNTLDEQYKNATSDHMRAATLSNVAAYAQEVYAIADRHPSVNPLARQYELWLREHRKRN